MNGRCLFSAPNDFLGSVREDYQSVIPTRFQEAWRLEQLAPDESVIAWVVNPGQHFMVDEEVLGLFPSLSAVITPSTGSNHINRSACKKQCVSVYSLLDDRPGMEQISASAEFTFLLLLNTLRRLDRAALEVTEGRWRMREGWMRGHELQGKRVGLVGFGRIGRRMAGYCAAFGARTVYYDPYAQPESGAVPMPLADLFRTADAVCVCCALTPETAGMISGPLLHSLKKGACLVNTARGEVIDESALAALLKERPDLRVGLDVLQGEVTGRHGVSPLLPFHRSGQIVITPHIGGATVESQTLAAQGALRLLRGHLQAHGAAQPC